MPFDKPPKAFYNTPNKAQPFRKFINNREEAAP